MPGFIAPGMSVRPDQALLDQFTAPASRLHGCRTSPARQSADRGRNPCGADAGNPDVGQYPRRDRASQKLMGAEVTAFLGEPLIAMLAASCFASITLVYLRGGRHRKAA